MWEFDGQMQPKGNTDFGLNHLVFLSLCHEISTKTDHIIAHRYGQRALSGRSRELKLVQQLCNPHDSRLGDVT